MSEKLSIDKNAQRLTIALTAGAMLISVYFWMLYLSVKTPKGERAEALKAQIIETLGRQDAAWNNGDIDAFMADYLKSDDLRFASGGNVKRGWQATIDGYKARYPDKAAMGRLAFTDLEISLTSATDALVFGRWELTREADTPGGLFTLHMRKVDGRWIIMSDHTSSAQ